MKEQGWLAQDKLVEINCERRTFYAFNLGKESKTLLLEKRKCHGENNEKVIFFQAGGPFQH